MFNTLKKVQINKKHYIKDSIALYELKWFSNCKYSNILSNPDSHVYFSHPPSFQTCALKENMFNQNYLFKRTFLQVLQMNYESLIGDQDHFYPKEEDNH